MLPLEPEELMPAVEPMPRVAPELRVNVPAPLTTLAPQLSVPPLLTVKVLLTEMPLFKVNDAPLSTKRSMFAVARVPADCVNEVPGPWKCITLDPPRDCR